MEWPLADLNWFPEIFFIFDFLVSLVINWMMVPIPPGLVQWIFLIRISHCYFL
jgi:hypothetical protein